MRMSYRSCELWRAGNQASQLGTIHVCRDIFNPTDTCLCNWPHGELGMTSNSKVSVILPTYNRAHLVGETLDSLLNQYRPADEIIVIDDGSTDETSTLVAEYGDQVRYVFQQNTGKSGALNHALSLAVGDLIWICDDDDLILPAACQLLAEALEADHALDFVAGRFVDFERQGVGEPVKLSNPGYEPLSAPDEIFPDLLEGCHVFQPGLMVRRSVYKSVGLFDTTRMRSQDYEMLLRIARNHRGKLLNELVFHHRVHQGLRGSADQRFSWKQADKVWIDHNREIFADLVPGLSDQEILPISIREQLAPKEFRRAAELKRATVYARAQMWWEALAIWRAVSESYPDTLSQFEIDMIRRATQHAFGCDPLLDTKDMQVELSMIARSSELGTSIAKWLRRSVHWRLKYALKRSQFAGAARVLSFLARSR